MNIRLFRGFLPYGLAIAAPSIALCLTFWLEPFVDRTIATFFYLAVVVSSWCGGWYPGWITIALSLLALNYYFIPGVPPFQATAPDHLLPSVVFLGVSFLINRLGNNQRESKRLNAELDQRMAERAAELTVLSDRLNVAYQEKLQTLQALAQSDESRRLALDLTHLGYWDWHIQENRRIWNDNHFTLLGLVPHSVEPTDELWRSCVHPDDRDWVDLQFLAAITNHTDHSAEYRVVYPDGSVHWVLSRARGLYDETGQPQRVLGVLLDISDRKQAEAAVLQEVSQKQLLWRITQTIRQSLHLPAVLHTTVTEVKQLLTLDRAAIYRFTPDWGGDFIAESVGAEWSKLVDINLQKTWDDTYLQETQGGRFRNNETFVIPDIYSAGLQPCHIELLEQFQVKAYAVVPIFAGETLWGLLAIYQNTHAHDWQDWEIELLQQIANQLGIALQQAELYRQLQTELQERRQAESVLRETERRWRSLLENVQAIVVGLNSSGNINYVNPFFLQLTGYTRAEMLGKNWFKTVLPASDQPSVQVVFAEVLRHDFHPHYQNSILTKSGEERLVAWNNTILQDGHGNPIGVISIGEDITERLKMEQVKQDFISIVSHELRTPLTSIRGSLGLVAGGVYDNKPEKMKEMIAIAARQSDRLVRLVNDILDLRRIESGQSRLNFKHCLAADLIQQSVEVMRSQAEQSQITLSVIPTDAAVWADSDAIVQTLTNLMSNAIKFSPPHTTVTLTTAPVPADSQPMTRFSVQDDGRGIPANQLETIFGQFHQVDASDAREKGGTGLGLAICRSIVEHHGGKIWVESVLHQGSTFYFILPAREIPQNPENPCPPDES